VTHNQQSSGPDTIHELRHSLLLADLERSGGIGVHASPLAEVSDVGNVLQKAGFALPATGETCRHSFSFFIV
jgi:hypothetical protein